MLEIRFVSALDGGGRILERTGLSVKVPANRENIREI